jgi:hypothetical protein
MHVTLASTLSAVLCLSTLVAAIPSPVKRQNAITVRVEIDTNDDASTQGEVPADGSLTVLSAPFIGQNVFDAFITDEENAVAPSCDAFSDANGHNLIGSFRLGAVPFNGQNIVALRCQQNF